MQIGGGLMRTIFILAMLSLATPALSQQTICRQFGGATYCDTQPQYAPPPPIQQFNVVPLIQLDQQMRARRAQEQQARLQAEANRLQAERNSELLRAVAQKEAEEIARDGDAGRRRVETRRILADLLTDKRCASAIALVEREGDDVMKSAVRSECGAR